MPHRGQTHQIATELINLPYNAPADGSGVVLSRDAVIKSITARVDVVGSDAGAVTAVVKKAASGAAVASGTALHSGTINLKGTAHTNQTLTLAAGVTKKVAAGEAIGLDVTGTTTAARGVVTVEVQYL